MTAAHVAGKFCMVFVTVPSREVAKTIAGGELEIDIVYLRPNSDECLEYFCNGDGGDDWLGAADAGDCHPMQRM